MVNYAMNVSPRFLPGASTAVLEAAVLTSMTSANVPQMCEIVVLMISLIRRGCIPAKLARS